MQETSGFFNTSACFYSWDIFDKDLDETLVRREGRSKFECCLLQINWHKIINEETRHPAKAGGRKTEHGKTSGLVFLVSSLQEKPTAGVWNTAPKFSSVLWKGEVSGPCF